MVRKFLLTIACALWAISAAQAADIAEPPPMFDWTGPYVGIHLGYGDPSFDGVYDSAEADEDAITFADEINADGVLGGIQAGYNFQMDNIVLGIEADISFTDFSGDAEDDDEDGPNIIEADVDYLASLRARLGFAADTFLVYATGGVAYTEGKYEFTDNGTDDAGSIDIDEFGFVVGGGVEWAASETISLRVEGLYYGFGDDQDLDGISDGDDDDFVEFEDVIAVRAGLNFRL